MKTIPEDLTRSELNLDSGEEDLAPMIETAITDATRELRAENAQLQFSLEQGKAKWASLSKELEISKTDNLTLRAALKAMAEDGWLSHGPEGMDETQQQVYNALIAHPKTTVADLPEQDQIEESASIQSAFDRGFKAGQGELNKLKTALMAQSLVAGIARMGLASADRKYSVLKLLLQTLQAKRTVAWAAKRNSKFVYIGPTKDDVEAWIAVDADFSKEKYELVEVSASQEA